MAVIREKNNMPLEFSVLGAVFNTKLDKELRNKLNCSLNVDLFGLNESREIWDFVLSEYLNEGAGVPSLEVAQENNSFPKKYATLFAKGKPLKTEEDIDSALRSLKKYADRRKLSQLTETLYDGLAKNEKISKLISLAEDTTLEIRSGNKKNEDIATGGVEDDLSTKELLNSLLSDEKDKLSPTGFKQLDKLLGGGCGDGDLITICANTGGGKSAAVCNLLKYVYSVNHENVVLISLEMKNIEIYGRLMSNVADVSYRKIKSKLLSDDEKKQIKKAWRAFESIGDKHDCKYILWSPTEDVDIKQALIPFSNLKPGSWVIIDYLNLLSDFGDDKNEAQSLAAASRYAKRWAQGHQCKVVLLSQLDTKTNNIRYSRAVTENSNIFLTWNYGQEDRESQTATWQLQKSRSSELGEFEMRMNLGKMRISDLMSDKRQTIGEDKKKDANEEVDDMLNEDDF